VDIIKLHQLPRFIFSMSLDPSDHRNEAELERLRPHPKVQDPVAITFTPTTVIASWFNESNEFEYLTQPASPEFQSHYKITVDNYKTDMFQDDGPPEDGSTDDLKAMFAQDFVPLTARLTERLGHEPRYLSLVLPSVCKHAIGNAGRQALDDINGSFPQIWSASSAMAFPWGFFEGSKLGREFISGSYSEPGKEYRPNMVLVLEYEQDYLFALVHEIDGDMGVPVDDHVEFSRGLGERYSNVSQSGVGVETYHGRLKAFMADFVTHWSEETQHHDPVLPSDIRAIVIAGEVSSQALTALGTVTQELLGTGIPQVLADFQNPTLVTARGAACRAQMLGRPSLTGECSLVTLTDEEYEQQAKEWDEIEKKRKYEQALLGRLESPEEWAKRKPKLITAAGEKSV
jgi:hypothetical protein